MPAKDTAQLENELKDADDLEKFDAENAENFRKYTLAEYLKKLLDEKNLSKTEVIKTSWLGDYLLYYAGHKKLYVRDAWDHVIWYALKNGNDISETNELLMASELYPLLGNVD